MKIKLPVVITVVVVVASVVSDFIFKTEHGEIELLWSGILEFFLLFGLIGCVLLIFVGKLIGRYWLHREEDYYD